MCRTAAIFILSLAAALAASGQNTNFAVRVPCEVQSPSAEALKDLRWIQGSTPLIELAVLRSGQPFTASTNTTVRMLINSSPTGTQWGVATNYLAEGTNATTSFWVSWGIVGTNTANTAGVAQAWTYLVFFEENGRRWWTGSGRLFIEPSTATGDEMNWISLTNLARVAWGNVYGSVTDNVSLVNYIAGLAGADSVARAGVSSNAASIAILTTNKLGVDAAALAYQPIGSYLTASDTNAHDGAARASISIMETGKLDVATAAGTYIPTTRLATRFPASTTAKLMTMYHRHYQDVENQPPYMDLFKFNETNGVCVITYYTNGMAYERIINFERGSIGGTWNFWISPTIGYDSNHIAVAVVVGTTTNKADENGIIDLGEQVSGISASTATGIAQTVATSYGFAPTSSVETIAGTAVANAMTHGLKPILPAVVEGGAVTIWAESNAWWDVDCSVNAVTAAVPWVINTNGWTSGELPIVGIVIRRGTNTFALPAGAVTNSAMPAASTTNAYVLWNNGTDWVFE